MSTRETRMLIADVAKILAAILLLLWVISPRSQQDAPPMDGYISRKSCHPVYYPYDATTPVVYCLGITSSDHRCAWSWQVSEDVYNSYCVGDMVGFPTNMPSITLDNDSGDIR